MTSDLGLKGLHRFVYTSRSSRHYSREEMLEMCKKASARNKKENVTGLLLYDGLRFLQALEGPSEIVQATIERILRDDRHFDVSIIFDHAVRMRQFGDWSMERPFEDDDVPADFLARVKSAVSTVSDCTLRAQFIGFAALASTARFRP